MSMGWSLAGQYLLKLQKSQLIIGLLLTVHCDRCLTRKKYTTHSEE